MSNKPGRKIVWLVALICFFLGALLLIVAPFFTGIWVEKNIRQQIAALNQSSPLAISINYYQRSWWNSVVFSSVALPSLNLTFNFLHEIQHGPINSRHFAENTPLFFLAGVYSQAVLQQQTTAQPTPPLYCSHRLRSTVILNHRRYPLINNY